MFINLLILSAIIVAFLMAALSVKTFFGDDSGFEAMSCHSGEENDGSFGCASCEIKEIANCDPNTNKLKKETN